MKPPFTLNNHILQQMLDISHASGSLQTQYERNLQLRRSNRIRAIQSTLAIENNSLTLAQVTSIINGKTVLGHPQDIREVQNAWQAYDAILDYDPYNIDALLYAHRLLMQDLVADAGHIRHKDVGIYDADGSLIHIGARPDYIMGLLQDLFHWAKNDDTPLLIKSAVVHYELEVIHPFADGNGRIGRLWQTVLLARWNPLFAWLPVETLVQQAQDGYYRALRQADAANSATPFIEYMLARIHASLQDLATPDET